jgi:hypothetical protein
MDPVTDALWAAVLEAWDDDARHAAFISHCRMNNALGAAARRYRAIAEDDEAYRSSGGRSDDAKKRLASITTLALLELQATATTPDEVRRPARWLGVVAVLFAVAAGAVLVRACS